MCVCVWEKIYECVTLKKAKTDLERKTKRIKTLSFKSTEKVRWKQHLDVWRTQFLMLEKKTHTFRLRMHRGSFIGYMCHIAQESVLISVQRYSVWQRSLDSLTFRNNERLNCFKASQTATVHLFQRANMSVLFVDLSSFLWLVLQQIIKNCK